MSFGSIMFLIEQQSKSSPTFEIKKKKNKIKSKPPTKKPKQLKVRNINRGKKGLQRIEKLSLRDGWNCKYCNIGLTQKTATIDHVIPRSKGGRRTLQNEVLSCSICNNQKDNKTLEDFLKGRGYDDKQ